MDKLVIEGGNPLKGSVQVSGAKNAALPILFATLLSEKVCKVDNLPSVEDIKTTLKLLKGLGVQSESSLGKSGSHSAVLDPSDITCFQASYELVRTMRASILTLGPLLARFGQAEVSLPGGCSIGARPVNLHLNALEKMGATIELDGGYIHARCKKLKGAEIVFDKVSVGATENTMMAAALAEGTTVIENAAREPEIIDLARFLRFLGAKVEGEGTPTIIMRGVSSLGPKSDREGYSVLPDRIEAGTYLAAAAMTGGDIVLPGVTKEILGAVLDKISSSGAKVSHDPKGLRLQASAGALRSVDITTEPFPGFPTDMQAQFMALMTVCEGTSIISETIFENRFMHVAELSRLGADIAIQGNTACVRGRGPGSLKGATVMATDLRASACLVLAGLAAKGTTHVRRIYHLDRGYERMEDKLRGLGAQIQREKE